jgi:hypothetical protein
MDCCPEGGTGYPDGGLGGKVDIDLYASSTCLVCKPSRPGTSSDVESAIPERWIGEAQLLRHIQFCP